MKAVNKLGDISISLSYYDVFGYFIPGITFFMCAWAFDSLISESAGLIDSHFRIPVMSVFSRTTALAGHQLSVISILVLISYISAFYVAGHVISSCSSFFGEKILIAKAHRYPFERFLGINYGFYTDISSSFFKGTFFWFNAYIVIRYFHIFKNNPICDFISDLISFFLIAFIIGKFVLSIPVRADKKWKKLELFFHENKQSFPWYVKSLGLLFDIYASPYNFLGYYLASIFRTRNAFSPRMIRIFRRGFRRNFKQQVERSGSNSFWLPNCYIRINSPVLTSQLNVFFHNYSYARNIAAAFYSAFLYCFIVLIINRKYLWSCFDPKTVYLPIIYLAVSIVMFYRYYYIYLCYFSKFLFRSFVFLCTQESSPLPGTTRRPPAPPGGSAASGVKGKGKRIMTPSSELNSEENTMPPEREAEFPVPEQPERG